MEEIKELVLTTTERLVEFEVEDYQLTDKLNELNKVYFEDELQYITDIHDLLIQLDNHIDSNISELDNYLDCEEEDDEHPSLMEPINKVNQTDFLETPTNEETKEQIKTLEKLHNEVITLRYKLLKMCSELNYFYERERFINISNWLN
jgi:hypothetical protein